MNSLLIHFQLANLILCLLLAPHFLSAQAKRKLPSTLLGLNYCLYAVQGGLLILQLQGGYTQLIFLRPTIAMLLGPVFYLYYQSIRCEHSYSLRLQNLLHVLPALAVAIIFVSKSPLGMAIDGSILLSYSVYLILIVVSLSRGKLEHLASYAQAARLWLAMLAALMLINILLEIGVYAEIISGKALAQSNTLFIAAILFLCINAVTVFSALRRTVLMEWMYEFGEKSKEKYSAADLDNALLGEVFARWQKVVEEKALYKREFGITLSEAGKLMQVPARQLSKAVNHCYGKSFSQFLNDRRVEEAKRLMSVNPDMAVVDISYESGFSSKSNFNKEFSRVVGMSPTQYREKLEF